MPKWLTAPPLASTSGRQSEVQRREGRTKPELVGFNLIGRITEEALVKLSTSRKVANFEMHVHSNRHRGTSIGL
jgi:hypothetical protein